MSNQLHSRRPFHADSCVARGDLAAVLLTCQHGAGARLVRPRQERRGGWQHTICRLRVTALNCYWRGTVGQLNDMQYSSSVRPTRWAPRHDGRFAPSSPLLLRPACDHSRRVFRAF
jgi:hypothetical protein